MSLQNVVGIGQQLCIVELRASAVLAVWPVPSLLHVMDAMTLTMEILLTFPHDLSGGVMNDSHRKYPLLEDPGSAKE
jgi:hypothetical protein